MHRVARELRHFRIALAFLTRLPVPRTADHGAGRFARSVRYFALVGALVGAIAGAVLLLASAVLPMPVAAGLAIGAGVLVTGGLHEDGLADTADGLGGGGTPERALEIMRDSRIGAYAGLALVFSVGLRWAALAGLAPSDGAVALVVAHALSRAAIAPVLLAAPYARASGLATGLAGAVTGRDVAIALLLALAIAMLAGPACGLVALAAAAVAAGAMLAMLLRRLGGYTGDGLGAVQQAAEIAVLAALTACWR
jgi:adenosylcobinamide-GDP ribazoletransferase